MQIAIPVFEKITALDAVGPYEVLQRLPGTEIVFVGHEEGNVRTDNGFLGLAADAVFEDVTSPDIVVFPGGVGSRSLMKDERVLGWLHRAHETTRYTTSVCTGSLLLARVGLLEGKRATTHWAALDLLESLDVDVVRDRRWVDEGHVITSAGVAAGIDMCFHVVEKICGKEVAKGLRERLSAIRGTMAELVQKGRTKAEAVGDTSFERFFHADTSRGQYWLQQRKDTFRAGLERVFDEVRDEQVK